MNPLKFHLNKTKLFLVVIWHLVVCRIALAQNTNPKFLVEVGAYAEAVAPNYFESIEGVYETIDANYIYRYYVNTGSKEEAEALRKEIIEKGYTHARVIDVALMQSQCSVFCEYAIPSSTGVDLGKKVSKEVLNVESIFFDYDRYILRDKSKKELKKLASILDHHPQYTAELRAHTDSRGSLKYNEQLSQNRALAAKKYLIQLGVDARRIAIKTYGENAPIAKNQLSNGADTEVGRQFNRRVELIVKDQYENILNIVDRIYVPEDLQDQ